jgi:hypothetical protein
MKKLVIFVAVLCAAMIGITCSSPSSPGTDGTTNTQYTLSATVDGASFSSGAAIAINAYPLDISKRLVDIKGTSASLGQSIEVYFVCPSTVTAAAPVTISAGNQGSVVVGNYYQGDVGSNVSWTSTATDTASVTVNSFSVGPGDTVISVDFSYKAQGGAASGVQTVKSISAGTLRKK